MCIGKAVRIGGLDENGWQNATRGKTQIGQKLYQKLYADTPKVGGRDLQVNTHPNHAPF